jgi:fructose-bisphosphate aldolase class I
MPDSPEEVTTKGLDGLAERLAEYKVMGAVFTKWRSVIRIGQNMPSQACLEANADGLAQYASIVQKASLVPILEPEVLLDGDHTLQQAEKVTTETLRTVFAACKKHKVDLTELLLKSSMVLPGSASGQDASPEEIAQATINCFKNSVPKSVPGIVFLSGGQTPEQASENLYEICKLEKEPWQMTFSFSRALEEPVLEAWHGNDDDIDAAQEIFYNLCKRNSEARMGKFS